MEDKINWLTISKINKKEQFYDLLRSSCIYIRHGLFTTEKSAEFFPSGNPLFPVA